MGVTVFTDDGNGQKVSDVLLHNGDIKLKLAKKLYLDNDTDTYLTCAVDDVLDFYIAGSKDIIIQTNEIQLQEDTFISSVDAIVVTYASMMPNVVQQDLSGAGAISTLTYYTALTTTGADALTLADTGVMGQIKKIQLVVDGGDGTLTPTTLNGGTTITFADIGDTVELMWGASGWTPIALYNTADGTSAPVLA